MGAGLPSFVPPLFQDAAFYADFTRCGAQDVGEAILIGGTGRNSFTFSRASQATYFNAQGVLTTAANNQPRFAFDPVTLVPQGVLIEEQRTNLCFPSGSIGSSPWGTTNGGVTLNATTAPDGTNTASKITETATNTFFGQNYNLNGTSSSVYTWSFYAKAAERTQCAINVSGTSNVSCFFQLTGSGSVFNVGSAVISASCVLCSNGWYFCSVTFTAGASQPALYVLFGPALGGSSTYLGTLGYGFYIWGAQLELGSFPTSYIPTSGSAVTRAADAFSLQGINIPGNSFGNAAFVEFYAAPNPSVYAGYAIGFGSNSGIYNSGANNVQESNGFSSIQNVSTISPAIIKTCTGSDGVNGRAICMNGAVPTTGTGNFYNNTPLNLTFGALPSSSANLLNAAIKRVAFWTRNLSSAELQEIVNN